MISKLLERLKKSKKHRELFVLSQVKTDVPFQIRAMRDEREWTQAQLGQALGLPQSVISRMENPDSGFLSIKTLLRVASVFDVALIVRFAPFTELMHWVESISYTVQGLTPEALALKGFEKELIEIRSYPPIPKAKNAVWDSTEKVAREEITALVVDKLPRELESFTYLSVDQVQATTTFA